MHCCLDKLSRGQFSNICQNFKNVNIFDSAVLSMNLSSGNKHECFHEEFMLVVLY